MHTNLSAHDLENEAIKYWNLNNLKEARMYHNLAKRLAPEADWIRHNDVWFLEPNFRVTKDFVDEKKKIDSKYKNCKISVIVISYARPEGAMRIASTARVTASRPELVEILICTDESDPLLERYKVLPELDVSIIKEHRSTDKWNYLYKKSTGEIIVMMCDDVIFESWGWDEILRNIWPKDGNAVMFSDDKNGKEILEFPIISRKMADTLGYCAYPKLDHAGLDAFWALSGNIIGQLYYLADVWRTRHQHYEVTAVHNRDTRPRLNIIKDYFLIIEEETKKLIT